MSLISIDESELKKLIDERIEAFFLNNQDFLYDLLHETIENAILKKSVSNAKEIKNLESDNLSRSFRESFNEIEDIKSGKKKPKYARDFLDEV